MKNRCFFILLLSGFLGFPTRFFSQNNTGLLFNIADEKDSLVSSIDQDALDKLRNRPKIEVGKGISIESENKLYKVTFRFRMQNLLGFSFDEDFKHTSTEARVKRLRLRMDGYIFSEKIQYSIQLGFTPYDTKSVSGGNKNIVRDAVIYYRPNPNWNIGIGQTKIKANRAQMNSSSALQFVDRSIVNSQFNLDRDFGVFGEYNCRSAGTFNVAAKTSVTLGEGRNWAESRKGGLAYTGRLELYPMGQFKSSGNLIEGDLIRESSPKLMIGGAYSWNDRAVRLQGQRGDINPNEALRSLQGYFWDVILKYRGFAFYLDFMGRKCKEPLFESSPDVAVYTGQGLNIQTSYIFPENWEIALRNSTLFPEREVRNHIGYKRFNQTTLGVTRYVIGHNLKIQTDMSFNHRMAIVSSYNRWEIRLQVELGI